MMKEWMLGEYMGLCQNHYSKEDLFSWLWKKDSFLLQTDKIKVLLELDLVGLYAR